MASFKIKCRKIMAATAYKSALYEIEYGPGVFTTVYASTRSEALLVVAPNYWNQGELV